jgi:glycosyltransferase involved in cell wall biosynthesis
MVEIEHVPPAKTRFIPNGIQAPVATRTPGEMRQELGIPAGAPVVGMVAVLRPQKAYDVLVRAAAILKREVPGVRVLIVGGEENPRAELRKSLESLAAELGLGETLVFTGGRKDAFDVVGTFDVAALSSDFEGAPISILEYMEAGKPVVATRVGGVPDQIADGQTGILVEPQDPEALATALAGLLTDRDRAEAMGRAGRERRRAEFSIEATTRRVEELYDELYAAAAPRR